MSSSIMHHISFADWRRNPQIHHSAQEFAFCLTHLTAYETSAWNQEQFLPGSDAKIFVDVLGAQTDRLRKIWGNPYVHGSWENTPEISNAIFEQITTNRFLKNKWPNLTARQKLTGHVQNMQRLCRITNEQFSDRAWNDYACTVDGEDVHDGLLTLNSDAALLTAQVETAMISAIGDRRNGKSILSHRRGVERDCEDDNKVVGCTHDNGEDIVGLFAEQFPLSEHRPTNDPVLIRGCDQLVWRFLNKQREIGFAIDDVIAQEAVTRGALGKDPMKQSDIKHPPYFVSIKFISFNVKARRVKVKDNMQNMDEKTKEEHKIRYLITMAYLGAVDDGLVQPGSSIRGFLKSFSSHPLFIGMDETLRDKVLTEECPTKPCAPGTPELFKEELDLRPIYPRALNWKGYVPRIIHVPRYAAENRVMASHF